MEFLVGCDGKDIWLDVGNSISQCIEQHKQWLLMVTKPQK